MLPTDRGYLRVLGIEIGFKAVQYMTNSLNSYNFEQLYANITHFIGL